MAMRQNRQTVADIQSMKARGQKISMLYVTTLEEAAAADAAGVTMLSIESRFFSPEMREVAGRCFVQVGLPYGPFGKLATAEDYLREAFRFMAIGGDCFYCAASLDIQKNSLRQRRSRRGPRRIDPLSKHLDRGVESGRQDRGQRQGGLGPREAA